jgi:hypothetical protein
MSAIWWRSMSEDRDDGRIKRETRKTFKTEFISIFNNAYCR